MATTSEFNIGGLPALSAAVQQWWDKWHVTNVPGKLLFAGLTGSWSVNCGTGLGSDADVAVVFAAPVQDVLYSLTPVSENLHSDHMPLTVDGVEGASTVEVHLFEVRGLCRLLLAGDFKCLEVLYTHSSLTLHTSELWTQLQALRAELQSPKYGNNLMSGSRSAYEEARRNLLCASPKHKGYKKIYLALRHLTLARQLAANALQVWIPTGSPEWEQIRYVRSLPEVALEGDSDTKADDGAAAVAHPVDSKALDILKSIPALQDATRDALAAREWVSEDARRALLQGWLKRVRLMQLSEVPLLNDGGFAL